MFFFQVVHALIANRVTGKRMQSSEGWCYFLEELFTAQTVSIFANGTSSTGKRKNTAKSILVLTYKLPYVSKMLFGIIVFFLGDN